MQEKLLSAINLDAKPDLTAIQRVSVSAGSHNYQLPQHWILHLYDYYAEMLVDDHRLDIYPGCITLVPPDSHVQYKLTSRGSHFYAHFMLPPPLSEGSLKLPIQTDVRGNLYHFEQAIIGMGRSFIYRKNRLHAEIKLWDLLWELVSCGGTPVAKRHPCLEKSLQLIDARLGEEISVTALAREVGISRNHLTRLFQMEKRITVVAYIRQQRARRAKHLLESSTLPINSIATEVHSPNLQSFSTLVKQETGYPPTHWRRQMPSK